MSDARRIERKALDGLPWAAVDSSNVTRLAWVELEGKRTVEGDSLGELWVEFKSGGSYVYVEVPSATYSTLLNAKSVGSMLLKIVRGRYPYEALDVAEFEYDPYPELEPGGLPAPASAMLPAVLERVAVLEAKVANLERALKGALRVPPSRVVNPAEMGVTAEGENW